MDIEGMGGVLISHLAQAGLVKDPADLYSLQAEELLKLERLGKKSVEKLLANIEKSKNRPQANLIYALGVKHVGARMAEILAEEFHCLKNLIDVSIEQLDKVEGVGPSIAEAIVQFFQDTENRQLIDRLAALGVQIEASNESPREKLEQTLANKTFVITGTLSMERSDAEKLIKARGGKVTSSVSKKTDYVVVGANPGSKFQKAQELGITVLDEGQFKLLLGV
jgi:DNA ligase (NAD+)